MKPKFEINEVARIMVAGDVIRIHEIFITDDDIGDLDKAVKYVAVSIYGSIFRNLDERMIMKESHQEYGEKILKAGEIDVSKEIRRVAVPIKIERVVPAPEKPKYKQKNYKKKTGYKRRAVSKKPKTTRTKKPDKSDPFKGMPDI